MNKVMRQLGVHRLVWMPLRCWKEGETPSHYERLLVEGQYIWLWDPELNERGRQTGGTPEPVRRYADMMVLGKRHRTRQLMKFRNKRPARSFVVKDQEEVNRTKLEEGRLALQKHNRFLPFLTRLQRRPLKRQHGFDTLGTVQRLRGMSVADLTHLLEMGERILDGTSRSIFLRNFRLIMSSNSRVIAVTMNLKSPAFAAKGFEKKLLGRLRSWVKEWRHAGILVICSVRIVACSADSLLSALLGPGSGWRNQSDRVGLLPLRT